MAVMTDEQFDAAITDGGIGNDIRVEKRPCYFMFTWQNEISEGYARAFD